MTLCQVCCFRFCFRYSKFSLPFFAVIYIGAYAYPALDDAGFIPFRMSAAKVPPIYACFDAPRFLYQLYHRFMQDDVLMFENCKGTRIGFGV